ncbi:MAG: VWA domain-containing protein [Deltaproteobacteria bacterium]|nr:VWA domain-containing protein [Deltaproteobacteria bacterium]
MKNRISIFVAIFVAILISWAGVTCLQAEVGGDKSLSPYFLIKSDDAAVDQMPLKSTHVTVNISGVIADVRVTQVYKNEGKSPLEAVYIFPASTRAAVYGMRMTIGERIINAKIAKRGDARQQYENARNAGQSASLLEQQRPNVFQMNVANILPSDVIKVELQYTELLVPDGGVYGFVYPTVVGPRYSNQDAAGGDNRQGWVKNPYLHEGKAPTYTFDMKVNIAAGMPLQDVTSTSHKINVQYEGSSFSTIILDPAEKTGGNRDFILKYRLAGKRIASGLLLFEGKDENFFLLMMQPPKRPKVRQIPPREYIFIVDVSGSMRGFPLNISKKLLKDLLGNLRPTDTFNVLLFAGGSKLLSERSLQATPQNIQKAIYIIDRQRGGGGTRLLPALKRALKLPKTEGCSRSIVIATDGYVTVEEEAFDLIRHNLGKANMFTFGIGSSVNRHLIEGMARVGMGEPFVITKPEEASEKADGFRKIIQTPVLTGIKIDFGGFQVYDVEPESVPDIMAERPVIVFGKWRGRAMGRISLKGMSGDRAYIEKLDVGKVNPLKTNGALRYLWARHRITLLSDYNRLKASDERVQEVTNLGLTYNLLTAYTSFVAVDTQVRLKDGRSVMVKQPLPLPQGVSDSAVGGRARARIMGLSASLARQAPGMSLSDKFSLGLSADCAKSSQAPLAEEEARPRPRIRIGEIAASRGLDVRSVGRAIERQLPDIETCMRKISGKTGFQGGEVVFKLVVSPEGRVTKIHLLKGQKVEELIRRCIMEKLKVLTFPVSNDTGKREITVAFTIT